MNKNRVCVLGAGISGLVAACTLQDKGHEVVVLERGRRVKFDEGAPPAEAFDDDVGGKCFTKHFAGQPYELGACSVSPEFSTVLKYARRFKAPVRNSCLRKSASWGEVISVGLHDGT